MTAEISPPVRAGRTGPTARLGLFLAMAAAALTIAWFLPLPKFSLCAFQLASGRPCPGCGMTRSIVALCRGDLVLSLRFHPLGIVLAGMLAGGIAGAAAGVLGRRDFAWEFMERRGGAFAAIVIAALIGVWIVRGFVVPSWSPDPVRPAAWPF